MGWKKEERKLDIYILIIIEAGFINRCNTNARQLHIWISCILLYCSSFVVGVGLTSVQYFALHFPSGCIKLHQWSPIQADLSFGISSALLWKPRGQRSAKWLFSILSSSPKCFLLLCHMTSTPAGNSLAVDLCQLLVAHKFLVCHNDRSARLAIWKSIK